MHLVDGSRDPACWLLHAWRMPLGEPSTALLLLGIPALNTATGCCCGQVLTRSVDGCALLGTPPSLVAPDFSFLTRANFRPRPTHGDGLALSQAPRGSPLATLAHEEHTHSRPLRTGAHVPGGTARREGRRHRPVRHSWVSQSPHSPQSAPHDPRASSRPEPRSRSPTLRAGGGAAGS